jgi:hypothetical protein
MSLGSPMNSHAHKLPQALKAIFKTKLVNHKFAFKTIDTNPISADVLTENHSLHFSTSQVIIR